MNTEHQHAILTIALYAAFSDGIKDDREREEIRRIAETLAGKAGTPDLPRIYQNVLLKRVRLEDATAILTDPGLRQLAYEMAVCVCDADGRQSEPERCFLADLKKLLQLDAEQAAAFESDANTIAHLSETAAPPLLRQAARKPRPARWRRRNPMYPRPNWTSPS